MSLFQKRVPDRLLGRVNSLVESLGLAGTLTGAVLGGFLGERLGLRATMWIGTGVMFIAAGRAIFSPVRTVR